MSAAPPPVSPDPAGPAGGAGETGAEPGTYAAARLRLLTGEGRPGPPRRRALAELTDAWLAGLLGDPGDGVALVAVGGYGRGELSPRSDLDLLLVHTGRDIGEITALADRLWYPVWDLGIALDHSVRTPEETRRAAAEDLRVQLGLLDARHVAGDAELTAGLRTELLARWRADAPRRLAELREAIGERARRHGELRFLLEPDLKEARGGLRDATALRAVAASWLADAPREGLDEARRTLLDIRDALQLATGRATDRLALQEQDQIAEDLALPDADALLRRVYEAARVISYAGDVTWREVGRVLRSRARPAARPGPRTPLAENVVEQDGEVVLARTARPGRDPVLTLRAAAAAAQAGLPLARPAVRAMAADVPPLPVPWPAEAREAFVTLLGAGEPLIGVWEALEAEGLVTALLPDWERVRCRPQRNAVHRWTVDRHLIETAVRARAHLRRVGRPDLLLVGALLHDIGKGWPGDHSVTGETIARDMAARMGFGAEDADTLATLVRHHLLLVETATRRDLDDPATVTAVAGAVRGAGTLELLHALTEADAKATGPAAWSAWRAGLVSDLVERVGAVLTGEEGGPGRDTFRPPAGAERLAAEARRTGGPVLSLRTRTEPAPPGVRSTDGTADGTADTAVEAVADAAPETDPEPVGVELLIALPDQPGALPAAAGVLALHRLTVRTADLRAVAPPGGGPSGTGPSGEGAVLLLSWRVAAEYGSLPQAARLRADLVRALDGSLDIPARLAERERAYRGTPRHRRGAGAPPPRVTVAPAGSRLATVLEVRAQDAPGLLYRIGRALEDAGVAVRSAHVSTLGANAVDAFYVTGPDGAPLPAEEAAELARDLGRTLGG
ncbi:[protein-PII] uridylyltransferase [Streptomyces carminius]|uniref:Bifunctional uridylyltransferase/uridylyl-removing enzyme n=1 Tax=Streptomyces carminius TaxID=2665496 RepID=A0A2M8M505_9ACTN|nr:[protein-PII] uridylyltransferase [Streptomyces carminius]PJE99287.1 [protein-PII] uridylyltransferase [Streptomyces carminius]